MRPSFARELSMPSSSFKLYTRKIQLQDIMSSSSDNNTGNNHSFLNSLRDSLAPHDQTQRRLSQGAAKETQPRRKSEESTASFSSAASTETHRDATGVGSQFLEDLTPGRQTRRRSSILEALSSGMGAVRDRRGSAGSVGEQRQGAKGADKGAEGYLKYV
ncbi:hypothetical protein SUNI508_03816 [Seiridium unicorne]|uniref:Uncharacterized protein n=1 Tax=Seiridium unicorne TaxID=138068 RepID=A0ABR2VA63_9PEZI